MHLFRIWVCVACFCVQAQQKTIPIVSIQEVLNLMNRNTDSVYVLNFWATWCGPCVKELPDFVKVADYYKTKPLKIVLISLDFKKDYNKLTQFASKKQLKLPIMLLDEPKYHTWIDKIDSTWQGAIPATLILHNRKSFRTFIPSSITFESLQELLNPLLP